MITYLLCYMLLMSGVGFWSMWEDKKRAVRRQYRISEKTLFIIALLGGSIGSMAGMHSFRHKTKHWTFKLGMPAILIIQAVVFFMLQRAYWF